MQLPQDIFECCVARAALAPTVHNTQPARGVHDGGVLSLFCDTDVGLTVGDPTVAVGRELDVIAAVVIGGGSLSGGEGSILGTMIGALIMAFLRNGCNMTGIPNYVQEIIIGVIIIGAVAIDKFRHRAR